MIVRYLLETCDDVASALARLAVIPSHMAYNLVLADRAGHVASVELAAGGGMRRVGKAIATNHQQSVEAADRAALTRTVERRAHLEDLLRSTAPEDLRQRFLEPPLRQDNYAGGFGTLFTAEYEPARCALTLAWPSETWTQRLNAFREGRRTIVYAQERAAIPSAGAWGEVGTAASSGVPMEVDAWLGQAIRGDVADWSRFGRLAAWVFASPASGSH